MPSISRKSFVDAGKPQFYTATYNTKAYINNLPEDMKKEVSDQSRLFQIKKEGATDHERETQWVGKMAYDCFVLSRRYQLCHNGHKDEHVEHQLNYLTKLYKEMKGGRKVKGSERTFVRDAMGSKQLQDYMIQLTK